MKDIRKVYDVFDDEYLKFANTEALYRRGEIVVVNDKKYEIMEFYQSILADEAHTTFFNKARTFRDAMLNIPPRIGRIVAAEAYESIATELGTILEEIPDTLLQKIQSIVTTRTELIMKSEIEQALKELSA